MKEKANERLGQWIKGKYRIDALLGIGGMAAVYSATHRNGSRLALKILHVEFARDENVKGRFLREGYVANKVDHPGRLAILDDDETESGESFLVMELLEGETLHDLWKRHSRRVPPIEAMRVVEAVLDTLGPFHEMNVIHRDLKPANIFITNAGVVKLLDFGVAQLREAGAGEMTRAGTALGTPSYMSPEQAMGKSDTLDGRSDVFAMGATLYAILSGARLHHGKSDNETFILAATQPAPSVARSAPELPVDVIALVDKALQWDRRNRFTSAHDMRDECRRVITLLGGIPYGTRGGGADTSAALTPAPTLTSALTPAPTLTPAGPPAPRPPPPPAASSPGTPRAAPAASFPPSTASSLRPNDTGGFSAQGPSTNPASQASSADASREQLRPARASNIDLSATGDRISRLPGGDQEDPYARIKEVFDRFERALTGFRAYTLNHPESKGRIRAIHRLITESLRAEPECLRFAVHPFCFVAGVAGSDETVPVWEPTTPSDIIPYNLCASGIEEMSIAPGVTEDEIELLVRALLADASTEGASIDIKRLLWEADFEHITYRVFEEVAADGEEDKLLTEVAHLESLAREDLREVAAMAVSTNQNGLESMAASAALELSPIERTALNARLTSNADAWRDRFMDYIIEAYADAEARGDATILLEPIARYGHHFVARDRAGELFALHSTLHKRIEQFARRPVTEQRRGSLCPRELTTASLTRNLFPAEVLRELLRSLLSEELTPAAREVLFDGLRGVLGALDASWFEDALATTNQLDDGDALELVMAYIQRHVLGREAFVIQRLDQLKPALAQRCLALVTATQNPEALALLKPLLSSSNAALRCEAAALLTPSDEQLAKLLTEWLESSDPKLRMAALTTMRHHHVRAAGPGLVKAIDAFDTFRKRPAEEQRQVFEALYALNPPRAETMLIQVVDQHGLMSDALLDRTRTIAAELLGKHGDSQAPIEALEGAARRRPWNTPDLRRAAGKAIELLTVRLGRVSTAKEVDA